MGTFDVQKARKVLGRVGKFLGILIRENLVKDAPFLDEGELENESDLADDVWEVLQMQLRQCDVGTAEEQGERCMAQFDQWRRKGDGKKLMTAIMEWAQMPYEEEGDQL